MKFLILASLFLSSCSGLQESEKEKLRNRNAKGEFIHRKHDESLYPLTKPSHRVREKYQWEKDAAKPKLQSNNK
jgi:gluconate kinase